MPKQAPRRIYLDLDENGIYWLGKSVGPNARQSQWLTGKNKEHAAALFALATKFGRRPRNAS